jgi:hypothetical protein
MGNMSRSDLRVWARIMDCLADGPIMILILHQFRPNLL